MSDSNDSDSRLSSDAGTSVASGKDRPVTPNRRLTQGSDFGSRSVDISHLEKDSEVLIKKVKKRLNKSTHGYQSFLEIMITWQRKRKLDKIKILLDTLFPKLKTSEGEVKQWLESLTERKEVYFNQGRILIKDLEGQMQAYEHNLDCLDEAINDVKQIDYDIVKEIAELKNAYHFNQEILKRTPQPRTSTGGAGTNSGRGSPRGDTASPPPAINLDADVINFDHDIKRRILTVPSVPPHVPVSDPAVWQGVKECAPTKVHMASSPFTKSLSKLLLTANDGSPRNSLDRPQQQSQLSSKSKDGTPSKLNPSKFSSLRDRTPSPVPMKEGSGKIRGLLADSPRCGQILSGNSGKVANVMIGQAANSPTSVPGDGVDAIKDHELVWGGAESKRRSLQSCTVSVQSILTSNTTSAAQNKSGSGKLPARPKSEEIPSTSIFKTSWSPHPSAGGSPPPIINPASIQSAPGHTLSNHPSSPRASLHGAMIHGAQVSIPGHHDPDGDLRKSRSFDGELAAHHDSGPKSGIAALSPTLAVPTPTHAPINLRSLLRRFPDDIAFSTEETDADQVDLSRRIDKCRMLKDTLKRVLETLQNTQDEHTAGLRAVKRLRTEMKNLFVDEDNISRESSVSATGHLSGYNSSSQSSTIDHVNSCNSLAHLDGGSGSGSISSGVTGSLDIDIPMRPHTPPAQHVSGNTLTYALQSGLQFGGALHHHGHLTSPDSPSLHFRPSSGSFAPPSATGKISEPDFVLQELAGDCVSDMRNLLDEERDARTKLAKLSTLIDNALTIDKQLSTVGPSVRLLPTLAP